MKFTGNTDAELLQNFTGRLGHVEMREGDQLKGGVGI